jgi:hypothetical protein
MAEIEKRLGPGDPAGSMRTLWRARLKVGNNNKDEFLFRAGEEFEDAGATACVLLDSSPSCKISGATIVAVERVAKLWN